MYFCYQEVMTKNGRIPSTHHARLTSTICREVDVVFSDEFIEDFKKANDRKLQKDHQTSNTNKAFWMRATLAHTQIMDCDAL
jgi:hypothetical protein